MPLHARAAIPEYWIVNLAESTVEVRCEPDAAAGAYRARAVVRMGEDVDAASVPGLRVEVDAIFR